MSNKIVTLGKYTFERAQMVQLILEGDGIECFLENVNLLQAAVSSGVKVRIDESDLKRALELVELLFQPDIDKVAKSKKIESKHSILLPVDFSDYSRKAADVAYDLACELKAELTIVHSYFDPMISTLPFTDSFVYDVNMVEISANLKETGESGLKKLKKYLNDKNATHKDKQVAIKSILLKGVAEDVIVDYSNMYKPTLIVMGTRGNAHKNSDLIGSVTAEVIEMAKVPVLAIPEDFLYQGINSLKNVLFATNFDESDFRVIDNLEKLMKPLNAKIHCTHAVPEKSMEWDEVRMEGLKKYIEEKYHEKNVVCDLLQTNDFWEGIENYIHQHKIDILCINAKRRNIISRLLNPSIAKKMLFHSTTPLLVFHN